MTRGWDPGTLPMHCSWLVLEWIESEVEAPPGAEPIEAAPLLDQAPVELLLGPLGAAFGRCDESLRGQEFDQQVRSLEERQQGGQEARLWPHLSPRGVSGAEVAMRVRGETSTRQASSRRRALPASSVTTTLEAREAPPELVALITDAAQR